MLIPSGQKTTGSYKRYFKNKDTISLKVNDGINIPGKHQLKGSWWSSSTDFRILMILWRQQELEGTNGLLR